MSIEAIFNHEEVQRKVLPIMCAKPVLDGPGAIQKLEDDYYFSLLLDVFSVPTAIQLAAQNYAMTCMVDSGFRNPELIQHWANIIIRDCNLSIDIETLTADVLAYYDENSGVIGSFPDFQNITRWDRGNRSTGRRIISRESKLKRIKDIQNALGVVRSQEMLYHLFNSFGHFESSGDISNYPNGSPGGFGSVLLLRGAGEYARDNHGDRFEPHPREMVFRRMTNTNNPSRLKNILLFIMNDQEDWELSETSPSWDPSRVSFMEGLSAYARKAQESYPALSEWVGATMLRTSEKWLSQVSQDG